MFQVSDLWKKTYREAHAGVLVMREVINPPHHAELEKRKAALEEELRARFAGQDRAALLSHPILQAYDAYYRQFKKTYHVQLQLESILFKGKSIPSVAALVEAMFMAEINDSASHGGTRSGYASSAPDAGRGARNRILYFVARRTADSQSR